MSRAPKGEWTDLERKFVAAIGAGMKPTEAAREAGYADPGGSVDQLMARPHVRQAVFRSLLKFNANAKVYWRDLIEDAKTILHVAMRSGDIDAALKAAGKVLDTATKLKEASISEAAEQEDSSSRDELAAAVMRPRELPPVVMADNSKQEH